MGKNNIVYEGLRCHVKAQTALVDYFVENGDDGGLRMFQSIKNLDNLEDFFTVETVGAGHMVLKTEWNDETKQKLFNLSVKKRILEMEEGEISEEFRFMLGPVLDMHGEDIFIDSTCFLVYALIRNERCREALIDYMKSGGERCYHAYKQSDYRDTPFLKWFGQEHRVLAKLSLGLIACIRNKEAESEVYYRDFMDIVYSGYKTLKNTIKKLHYMNGHNFHDFYSAEQDMPLNVARMVVQLAVAEDLGVPVVEDYDFYIVLQILQNYENNWVEVLEPVKSTPDGRRTCRKFQEEHEQIKSYFWCHFSENDHEYGDEIELLFENFGMKVQMLAGIHLEQKEVEVICSLFEDIDWAEYKQILLVASMCKYIDQMERQYEEQHPMENSYRESSEETNAKKNSEEISCLKQKICYLEQQKKELERELEREESRRKKLENRLGQLEELRKSEEKELNSLRNLIFQGMETSDDAAEKLQENHTDDKVLEGIRQEKLLVVGGHSNWQKKMKQCFPDSQFIAADNMNFDSSLLHNKRYIVFNTDVLKHSTYYKIMKLKKKEHKIIYVHGNNLEKILLDILSQI